MDEPVDLLSGSADRNACCGGIFCSDTGITKSAVRKARPLRRIKLHFQLRISNGAIMTNGHFDVIIIGTGAGGGTLARKLAPSGKKILILERGDYVKRETDNWN